MSPIELVIGVTWGVDALTALVLAVMSVWSLIVAVQAKDYAYINSNKRTKGFWVAVTSACTVFSGISLASIAYGSQSNLLLEIFALVATGVFLADVKPVVAVRRH